MLYVVPVPIGNLEDITIRGKKILETSDLIICEDSRETRKLLNLLEISNKPKFVDITRNHELNFARIAESLEYSKNQTVSLVTDAGTPGLSDPGSLIIEMAIKQSLEIDVLPGANALIPAIVASGFCFKDFYFNGFLPTKKGRQKDLKKLANMETVIVLYESRHRIEKLLEEITAYFNPAKKVFLARELTKFHQQYIHTTVSEAKNALTVNKGEYAVVIDNRASLDKK